MQFVGKSWLNAVTVLPPPTTEVVVTGAGACVVATGAVAVAIGGTGVAISEDGGEVKALVSEVPTELLWIVTDFGLPGPVAEIMLGLPVALLAGTVPAIGAVPSEGVG